MSSLCGVGVRVRVNNFFSKTTRPRDMLFFLKDTLSIEDEKLFKACKSVFLLRKIALPYPHKCLVWFCGAKRIDRQVFFKRIFLSAGDPLSAHVCACAVLIVDRQLSRDLHYIFGRYGSNTYFLLLSSIYRRRSMKF